MDILKLKSADHQRGVANISVGDESPYSIPCFEVNDQVVVEWRAMTVALLDRTHDLICNKLGCSQDEFNLAKVLEGGTWKAGRELAAQNRPETKEPPINIVSDGTVF
ncbi:hypothetical protein EV182_005895 [Spiromyces aspiralis]|uniref:Uncharacterized protein n=1 Tax=Spiromyces aspiralis TaxID=68401 RepID=A0ACC1HMZ2_9FUNG|nr:hypothetical protein EV182_005895 [Spiromyces aspiralis]